MNTDHTIAALCVRSDAISRDKGWVAEGDPRPFHTATALFHSELSEALEDWRGHKKVNETWFDDALGVHFTTVEEGEKLSLNKEKGFKPCGIPVELADFVIRVCQRCGTDGVGEELEKLFVQRTDVEVYSDLEELLAELHLSTSLAYSAKKQNAPEYLQYLADALAEVFTFCAANEVDLWSAIDIKEAYNRTRSARHGGKKI